MFIEQSLLATNSLDISNIPTPLYILAGVCAGASLYLLSKASKRNTPSSHEGLGKTLDAGPDAGPGTLRAFFQRWPRRKPSEPNNPGTYR